MSEAGTLFKRYIWLIDTVQTGRWTKEDLMGKWLNSRLNETHEVMADKTFHNHINAINNIFGLHIKCNKYGDKTYYIENENDLDEGSDIKKWLIDTIAVSNVVNECSNLRGRIHYENIPSGQQWLTSILKAMRDDRPIELTYEGFWGHGKHTFPVEPYFVKVFKQRWYLIAHSINDDLIRVYALDRIQEMTVMKEKFFKMPADFHADEFFEDCYGVIHGDEFDVETVRIKVTGNQAKYVRSVPLHSSQKEEEGGSDQCRIFCYRLKPTFDFIQEIFSHADDFEVLEPKWLCEEISRRVYNMFKYYNKGRQE